MAGHDIPRLIRDALASKRTRKQHGKPNPAPHSPETTRAGNNLTPRNQQGRPAMSLIPSDASFHAGPGRLEVPNPPSMRVPPGVGVEPGPMDSKNSENQKMWASLSEQAVSILGVMSDPEYVGSTLKLKAAAAEVDVRTWRKYMRDPEFRVIADLTVEQALVGRHRELIAIAFKYARSGSMKHFEWLARQIGAGRNEPAKTLEGTSGGDLHLHLHNATEEELENYVNTGNWTASSFKGIPAAPIEVIAEESKEEVSGDA